MKLLVVVVNYQLMQGETAQPIHMALSIFMLSIWPMKDVAKCSSDGSLFFVEQRTIVKAVPATVQSFLLPPFLRVAD